MHRKPIIHRVILTFFSIVILLSISATFACRALLLLGHFLRFDYFHPFVHFGIVDHFVSLKICYIL